VTVQAFKRKAREDLSAKLRFHDRGELIQLALPGVSEIRIEKFTVMVAFVSTGWPF
jgi:hypothetical protein